MENYFTAELDYLDKELTHLKTSIQRSSSDILFAKKSASVSIPLSLNTSQTDARGSIIFKITSSSPILVFPYLNEYYDDISKSGTTQRETRFFQILEGANNNNIFIRITAYGTQGANSDVQALINGQSITLNNTLTIYATDNFEMEQL